MDWTVFVVEGQTEQVFLRQFAELLVAKGGYHIELLKVSAGQVFKISHRGVSKDDASHFLQIVNVQGDSSVNTYVDENIETMRQRGVRAVYGLRDSYTGDQAKGRVDPVLIDDWADGLGKKFGMNVAISVAIEEVEAWFLSVPSFFAKCDERLTLEAVNQIAGVDLAAHDTQKFPHPAQLLDSILRIVGQRYRKRLADSERIAAFLDYETLFLEKVEMFSSLKKLTDGLADALP